jgi:electron transport complex protein RnfC
MSTNLSLRTFPLGGVHPPGRKQPAAGLAIETLPPPPEYVVPLLPHLGAPATPLVKKGATVAEGVCIGRVEKGLGAAVPSRARQGLRPGPPPPTHPGQVPAVAITPDRGPGFTPMPVDWESMEGCTSWPIK